MSASATPFECRDRKVISHELTVGQLVDALQAQLSAEERRAVLDDLLSSTMGGWSLRWPRPSWGYLEEDEKKALRARLDADLAELVAAIEAL